MHFTNHRQIVGYKFTRNTNVRLKSGHTRGGIFVDSKRNCNRIKKNKNDTAFATMSYTPLLMPFVHHIYQCTQKNDELCYVNYVKAIYIMERKEKNCIL